MTIILALINTGGDVPEVILRFFMVEVGGIEGP